MDHGLTQARPGLPEGAGGLLDGTDWSATPIGPRTHWPLAMRIALDLLGDSRFPMFVAWGEERILLYNEAYAALLGPRHPAALGRPMAEAWAESWPELEPLLNRALSGSPQWFEDATLPLSRGAEAEGEAPSFTFSLSPLRDGLGVARGVLGTMVETTARRRAERGLRAVLESIGDGFFAVDGRWRVTHVNPQGAALLGRLPEELLGEELWDAFPGLDQSRFGRLYRRVTLRREAGTERAAHRGALLEVRAFPAEEGGITVFLRDVSEAEAAAAALARSETRYRSFVEASSQLVWTTDPEGRVREPVPSWESFTGQATEEAQGFGWMDAVHAADRPRVAAAWARAASDGAYEVDYALRRHDGAWRQVRARGVAVRDPAGRILEWVGTCTDVTAQRLAEQRLALAMEGTSDGLWDWNILTGEVFHSPRWVEMLGYDPASWDSTYENWLRHTHPDDVAGCEAHLRAYLAGETAEYANAFRMRHRDGRWLWMLSRAKALRGPDGEPVRMVGAHTDITARMEAEAALAEREQRLRVMAEALPQIVWEATPDGRIVWFSGRWTEVTGLEGTEGWQAQLHPEDEPAVLAAWGRATATGEPYETELRLRTRGGTHRWHLARGVPVRDADGRIAAWFGTTTDIHDQREAREVLARDRAGLELLVEARTAEALRAAEALRHGEKLQAMGQLTGSLAHDFSNVLQVVESGLGLLSADGLTPDERAEVEAGVRASVDGARAMIRSLLAFARRQPLEPERLDLNARVVAMAPLLGRALGGGIALVVRLGDDAPPVRLDPGQLEAALLNLAMNARDAMPEGGSLTVSTGWEGGRATLAVADTGTGLSPEAAARLFEPFFTTKPPGHGTGLGLAQVHGFVAQSGGDIRVESEPGRGTCFTLLLPPAPA